MIANKRTIDEIRREGIEALTDRLGPSGMIRFLQQFDSGTGDYTQDRSQWLGTVSAEKIQESIEARRGDEPKS